MSAPTMTPVAARGLAMHHMTAHVDTDGYKDNDLIYFSTLYMMELLEGAMTEADVHAQCTEWCR